MGTYFKPDRLKLSGNTWVQVKNINLQNGGEHMSLDLMPLICTLRKYASWLFCTDDEIIERIKGDILVVNLIYVTTILQRQILTLTHANE